MVVPPPPLNKARGIRQGKNGIRGIRDNPIHPTPHATNKNKGIIAICPHIISAREGAIIKANNITDIGNPHVISAKKGAIVKQDSVATPLSSSITSFKLLIIFISSLS